MTDSAHPETAYKSYTALAVKLARRFKASFFNVGDIVLYGKYKNKKARILSFGQDAKGNPTVTLEPVPKGRKQNKTLTLFKIWKMPKPVEEKQAMTLARRIVARYKLSGVEMGRTVTVGTVRIHRYADHFNITDLTNAGLRGKKVKVMVLSLGSGSTQNKEAWLDMLGDTLPNQDSYEDVRRFVNGLKQDDPYVYADEREARGIDIEPTGAQIKVKTNTGLEIESKPDSFRVLNRQPMFHPKTKDPMGTFQDTSYFSLDKKSAAAFFAWLKTNLSRANNMSLQDLQEVWDRLGAKFDYR